MGRCELYGNWPDDNMRQFFSTSLTHLNQFYLVAALVATIPSKISNSCTISAYSGTDLGSVCSLFYSPFLFALLSVLLTLSSPLKNHVGEDQPDRKPDSALLPIQTGLHSISSNNSHGREPWFKRAHLVVLHKTDPE